MTLKFSKGVASYRAFNLQIGIYAQKRNFWRTICIQKVPLKDTIYCMTTILLSIYKLICIKTLPYLYFLPFPDSIYSTRKIRTPCISQYIWSPWYRQSYTQMPLNPQISNIELLSGIFNSSLVGTVSKIQT